METRKLTLGHSPDPDDAFMFFGLAADRVETHGWRFEHVLQDIQTLNDRARRGELDISAISIHAYPYVARDYALLPNGASMGDGYGPMVVAKKKLPPEELKGKTIAIPGLLTSAYLALQLWLETSGENLKLKVVPFDRIFAAVKEGSADAGLIIHEGQLTFQNEGLVLCQDLGAWWKESNDGLPLPLGGNVVHKRLDPSSRQQIAGVLQASIQYALDHRKEAVARSLRYARDMGGELADKFVGMYVNHWTLDYGDRGREAIKRFLAAGARAGLVPSISELEFVK